MSFYSPTTLLPPSPPYTSAEVMITSLCDHCLKIADCQQIPNCDVDQHFEVTMAILDFWLSELGLGAFV